MNAKFNGKNWIVDVTARQFTEMLEDFFKKNPLPSCDELYQALVPVGVPPADIKEGRFGPGGIFKYRFMSSDGIKLMVKYHKPDSIAARNYPGCNSGLYWTTQIICGESLFFGWNPFSKKASTVVATADQMHKERTLGRNDCHIPLRKGPSSGAKDWAHSSKVSSAGGDKPASFVLYGNLFIILKTRVFTRVYFISYLLLIYLHY